MQYTCGEGREMVSGGREMVERVAGRSRKYEKLASEGGEGEDGEEEEGEMVHFKIKTLDNER